MENLAACFALSVWDLSFKEKMEQLSTWILQFQQHQHHQLIRLFKQIVNPKIKQLSMCGRNLDEEVMRVVVTGDALFLSISWYNFYKISYKYKKHKIFPTTRYWKSWHDRIYVERLLEEKRDITEDRFRLFQNNNEYLYAIQEIYRKIQKTNYGIQKIRELLHRELLQHLQKIQCIEHIRKNWAALKIQKAYRTLPCITCGDKFCYGFGIFCSKSCMHASIH